MSATRVVPMANRSILIIQITFEQKLQQQQCKITCSPWTVTLSWQDRYISKMTYEPSKLGQTELVLVYDQSSLVGLCMEDYKSLYIAVMIYATMINTQTDTDTAFY